MINSSLNARIRAKLVWPAARLRMFFILGISCQRAISMPEPVTALIGSVPRAADKVFNGAGYALISSDIL